MPSLPCPPSFATPSTAGLRAPRALKYFESCVPPSRVSSRTAFTVSLPLHRPDHFLPHIGPQCLRDHHAAVLLLVVLDNRHPRTSHRQTAAVQRVRVLGLLASAVANVRAARLVGLVVAAGRDLLVRVLPRQPHLDVVRLRARRTHIAGAQHHSAEREAESPQDVLRVGGELLQFVIALLGSRELDQFHLLKLVLP